MKKNLITSSFIFLLLSCSSNELSTYRISKIVYNETGDEYNYVYNEDGTLSQIETKYFQATGVQTQSFFHTETSTITSSIYYLNHFEFDSGKLINI